MTITHHAPAARGVTTLQYVGDDALATGNAQCPCKTVAIGAAAAALLTSGTTRTLALGLAVFAGLAALRR